MKLAPCHASIVIGLWDQTTTAYACLPKYRIDWSCATDEFKCIKCVTALLNGVMAEMQINQHCSHSSGWIWDALASFQRSASSGIVVSSNVRRISPDVFFLRLIQKLSTKVCQISWPMMFVKLSLRWMERHSRRPHVDRGKYTRWTVKWMQLQALQRLQSR